MDVNMGDNPYQAMRGGDPAPKIQVHYRWLVSHRQYKVGDPVPAEAYGSGMVATLLANHRIEAVTTDPEPVKAMTEPPADRMMRPESGVIRTKTRKQ